MIKITEVKIKETKSKENYKNLKLESGQFVNMWGDDPDYEIANAGAELDRDIEKQGKYWNLLPAGEAPAKQSAPVTNSGLEELNKKIWAVYLLVQRIAKHHKIDEGEVKVEYPEGDINPDDIPF